MNRKKFEYDVMGNGSRIKAPRGFVEEDLRTYTSLGDEEVEESLNNAFKQFKNKDGYLVDPYSDNKIYGSSTGNIQVDIVDSEEDVGVSVYRLVRRWIKKK